MENKYSKPMWDLCRKLRTLIPSQNMYANVVKLLFIRYIAKYPDDFIHLAYTPESLKTLMEFSRKYSSARNGSEPISQGDLGKILQEIDGCLMNEKYGTHLADIMETMPYFFDYRTQSALLNVLDEFELDNNPKNIKECLEALTVEAKGDVFAYGRMSTTYPLRRIASDLLDVCDKDDLFDCFCGYSSLLLNDVNPKEYIGYELNNEAALVSLMTATMLKVRSCIYNQDFLYSETRGIADKVFVDPPLGIKRDIPWLTEKYQINTKDMDIISVYKAVSALKEDGKAVIAVPGKVLFSQSKIGNSLRNMLLENSLRAVLTLPALWAGCSINTNILLIDKTYHGDVMFVKAENIGLNNKKRVDFSENDYKLVFDAVHNEIEGISRYVNKQEIVAKDTLMPATYVNTVKTRTVREIEDIDMELISLYNELKSNLTNMSKR